MYDATEIGGLLWKVQKAWAMQDDYKLNANYVSKIFVFRNRRSDMNEMK